MKTRDLGLACLMASHKCELTGHELDARGQIWLSFRDTELCRQLEQQYYSGTVMVNLTDYLSAQKQMKTLIFSTRRQAYGEDEYALQRQKGTSL